jgi:hypothetical protein
VQVIRYVILFPILLLVASLTRAQSEIEVGFGVLGSVSAVDPIPLAFRNDFVGPNTYLGYYVEGSALLLEHSKWKPRAVVRLQTEGNKGSIDWPEIELVNAGAGAVVGYRLTPVITVLAGGVALYKVSSKIEPVDNDDPLISPTAPWSGRLNVGVRGNFGKWSSEMIFEKSYTTESGAVLLTRESSPSFIPSYSYLNVRLGFKYRIFQSNKAKPTAGS